MERLPGVRLDDFWCRSQAERQEIRDAFKIAYEYDVPLHLSCLSWSCICMLSSNTNFFYYCFTI